MPRYLDFIQKQEAVRLAAHAIGLDHKRPYKRHGRFFYRPYRNRFATHDRAPDHKIWQGMVDCGYAEVYAHSEYTYYCMTRKGLDWLGQEFGITIHDEED